MRKKKLYCYLFMIFALQILFYSCASKKINYINYYVKVNEADSTFRIANDTLKSLKMYKAVFKKYKPKNQYAIREFENYILFSDAYDLNFGGKKSIKKLIMLVAPNKEYFYNYPILKKYGFDSLEVIKRFDKWEKKLDRDLIDSFTIAHKRDQYYRGDNFSGEKMKANDKINEDLLIRLFESNNYPTIDKIGISNGIYYDIVGLLTLHISNHTKKFNYIDKLLYNYLKKGFLKPNTYAQFVDRKTTYPDSGLRIDSITVYDSYIGPYTTIDTIKINRNRKSIGLPNVKHKAKITLEDSRYSRINYEKRLKFLQKRMLLETKIKN